MHSFSPLAGKNLLADTLVVNHGNILSTLLSLSSLALKMNVIFSIESSSPSLIALSVLGITLPVIAVFLRLMARKVTNKQVDASDHCSITGCVSVSIQVHHYLTTYCRNFSLTSLHHVQLFVVGFWVCYVLGM